MIGFEQYAKVKDKYCICYFGYNDEYLTQLALVKPVIEASLPGIEIYLGCKDDKTHLLENPLKLSEIKIRRKDYAYVRELKFNGRTHPVKDLLRECGASIPGWLDRVPDCTN